MNDHNTRENIGSNNDDADSVANTGPADTPTAGGEMAPGDKMKGPVAEPGQEQLTSPSTPEIGVSTFAKLETLFGASERRVHQLRHAEKKQQEQHAQKRQHLEQNIARMQKELKSARGNYPQKDALIAKHKSVTDGLIKVVRVCEKNAYNMFPNNHQIVHDLFAPVNRPFLGNSKHAPPDTTTTNLYYDLVLVDATEVAAAKASKHKEINLVQEQIIRGYEALEKANEQIAIKEASVNNLWDAIHDCEVKAHQWLPYHTAVVDKIFDYLYQKAGRKHANHTEDTVEDEESMLCEVPTKDDVAPIKLTEELDNSKITVTKANTQSPESVN
ncbi:hypothetical protein HYALB_00012475 [Hymenoscyphus albidus]|uniref:Uncharacterized protein n=1 Tax=Hymenoscyphus albidus TaxID=595503 RepID=A0A9N9LNY4_9HELO|nr:hypothetical protein HYALB_00012475 [Hymenoscyphus albidus]